MKLSKAVILLIFAISYLSSSCTTSETESQNQSVELVSEEKEKKFPRPIGYVNDFEEVLTDEQEKALHNLLTEYEKKTTNQIAVVTVASIEPYSDFDQYAIELSKEWGVGVKGKDNGLTILLSNSLRRIRISTGLGTEKILTDEICKQIIDQTIVPKLKEGKTYEGITLGLADLIEHWK